MPDPWRDAWVAALDALEADVADVEAMLADDHLLRDNPVADPWSPPHGLGPLPLELKPRADAILSRQLAASTALAVTIADTRRHAAVVARLDADRQPPPPRPAYIDCAM